jgi:hypothetical protein
MKLHWYSPIDLKKTLNLQIFINTGNAGEIRGGRVIVPFIVSAG